MWRIFDIFFGRGGQLHDGLDQRKIQGVPPSEGRTTRGLQRLIGDGLGGRVRMDMDCSVYLSGASADLLAMGGWLLRFYFIS